MTHGTTTSQPTALTPGHTPPSSEGPEDLALVAMVHRVSQITGSIVGPLRRHPGLILATAIGAAALGIGLSFLVPVQYRSTATFFADRASRPMNLPSGLASIGRSLGVGGDDDNQSPDFYAWLATSDAVLSPVLRDTVPLKLRAPDRAGASAWEQFFDKPMPTDSLAWNKGLAVFKRGVTSKVNLQNTTITISAPGPTRELAMWTSTRVFEELNRINTSRRRTRAGNELRFLGTRREEAEQELRQAETRLSAFLSNNRQSTLPPFLRAEEDRLDRQVDVARDAYIAITRSAQEAELRAVRDIPALSLIEGPTYPIRKSKPRRLIVAIVAGLLGGLAAYALAWWRDLSRAEVVRP